MLVAPLAPPGSHGTARPPHLALRPCDVDDVQSIQVLDLQEVNHPVRPPRQPALSTAAPLLGWGGTGTGTPLTFSPLLSKKPRMASSWAWGSPRSRFTCSR